MESLIAQIGLALVVFASTNIDDILLLTAFFSDPKLRVKAIVIGQFLGIGLLVLVSVITAVLALSIPPAWLALLGILPIALGCYKLYELYKNKQVESEEAENKLKDNIIASEHQAAKNFGSQALSVASVTLANGGDNLGIYIPIFTAHSNALTVFVIVFAIMTAVWCLLGYVIVNNRVLGSTIRRYGHKILPFVLILLGLDILFDLL
jgi:cadmium resistance protein CadD (predicted permease)